MTFVCRYFFYLLPFVISCIPGVSLSEDIIIQAYDVYFPLLLVIILLERKWTIKNHNVDFVLNVWNVFVFILILSLLLTCLLDLRFYFSALLKAFRLIYPSILLVFVFGHRSLIKIKYFNFGFLLSMLICPLIGILGYAYQIDSLIAKQTTLIDGVQFYRAGSFWKDSGVLGVLSAVYSLISIALLFRTNYSSRIKLLIVISISLNLVALGLSFSRTGMLIVCIGIFIIICQLKVRKILFWGIPFFFILIFVISYLYQSNALPELDQLYNRFVAVLNFSTSNADDVSSGRTSQWFSTLDFFLFNSNIYRLMLGYGYKTDSNILPLSDNGLLYILITTGVIGLCCFIFFITVLFCTSWHDNRKPILLLVHKLVLCSWMISMVFVDSLTYIPVVVLCFLVYSFLKMPYNINNRQILTRIMRILKE